MIAAAHRTGLLVALTSAAVIAAACAPTPIDAPLAEGAHAGSSGADGQAGSPSPPPPSATTSTPSPPPLAPACEGDTAAFVHRAILAVLGRRPSGSAEVAVYEALLLGAENQRPGSGRAAVIDALTHDAGYVARWTEVYRDALLVQRSGGLANANCFALEVAPDPSAAALFVRDHGATEGPSGQGLFTMADVVHGALLVDDVTPIYLANLFGMLARSFTGANASPLSLELARRADFGGRFEAAYLHRDGVCLRCHNSETSVTFRDDPAQNRHFPLPGYLEKSLFGVSTGVPDDSAHDGVTRMRAVLRFSGVVGGTAVPWGMSGSCGGFTPEADLTDDMADVDGAFATLRGKRVSVWGLERSLRRGFTRLREHGLTRGPDGYVPDSDEAFAYLVSVNIVERVWEEVVGTRLTIATSFARNQAARDQLLDLTEAFIAEGFSHRALLTRIAQSPAFHPPDLAAPCLTTAYPYAAIYDPWVTDEPTAERRGNGPGDAVTSRTSRTMLLSTFASLGWPPPPNEGFTVYDSDSGRFQAEIGVPLQSTVPGFRGLDFGARLSWEQQIGQCQNRGSIPDHLDRLIDFAAAREGTTLADVVRSLKDRLVGEPFLHDEERPLLEALLEAPLESSFAALSVGKRQNLRRVCGVLLQTPQYLLSGLAPEKPPAGTPAPLVLPDDAAENVCDRLRKSPPNGWVVSCEGGAVSVEPTISKLPCSTFRRPALVGRHTRGHTPASSWPPKPLRRAPPRPRTRPRARLRLPLPPASCPWRALLACTKAPSRMAGSRAAGRSGGSSSARSSAPSRQKSRTPRAAPAASPATFVVLCSPARSRCGSRCFAVGKTRRMRAPISCRAAR